MPGYKKPMKTKRKSTYKKKAPRTVSTAVKAYVNRIVHTNMENKTIEFKDGLEFGSYNYQADLSVRPIYPTPACLVINQGVGQGDRIGNTITTRKLILKYCLYPIAWRNDNNPFPTPVEVMVWIGYLRANRQTTPTTTDYANFFQFGNGTQPPNANLWDCMSPVNKDLFHICKVFRHKLGYANYGGNNADKEEQFFANNDFKLNCFKTVDCTKYLNKVLKFNDVSTQSDTGLYMWCTAVASNNDQPPNQFTAGMNYQLRYEYEDA